MRLEAFIDFICGELSISSARVNEYTPLGEVFRDETEAAELALALESEYGFDSDEELDPEMTVGELMEKLEEL